MAAHAIGQLAQQNDIAAALKLAFEGEGEPNRRLKSTRF